MGRADMPARRHLHRRHQQPRAAAAGRPSCRPSPDRYHGEKKPASSRSTRRPSRATCWPSTTSRPGSLRRRKRPARLRRLDLYDVSDPAQPEDAGPGRRRPTPDLSGGRISRKRPKNPAAVANSSHSTFVWQGKDRRKPYVVFVDNVELHDVEHVPGRQPGGSRSPSASSTSSRWPPRRASTSSTTAAWAAPATSSSTTWW